MKTFIKACSLFAVALLFTACSSAPTLQEQLIGAWEADFPGVGPITLIYSETEITAEGFGISFPYTLEGDKVSFEAPGQGLTVSTIVIDGDTMTQTNEADGQAVELKRKN
ncbi:hypothetical protein NBRC116493_32870 [Aurantivibrio infirmus]